MNDGLTWILAVVGLGTFFGWGEGDPQGQEYYVGYEVYATRELWEEQIAYLTARAEPFIAMIANPAEIVMSVKVSVK